MKTLLLAIALTAAWQDKPAPPSTTATVKIDDV